MTQYPELHDALVDAARRYHAPRRRTWRAVRLAVPAVAVAVAAAVAVVVFRGGGADIEQPVPPARAPSIQRQLLQMYGVLHRPATPDDRLPSGSPQFEPGGSIYPKRTRLIVDEVGPHNVYLAGGRLNGRPTISLLGYHDGVDGAEYVSGGIASETGRLSLDYLPIPDDSVRAGGLVFVAPDGIKQVVMHFRDGSTGRVGLQLNVAYAALDEWPRALSWTDAAGRTQRIRLPADEKPVERHRP